MCDPSARDEIAFVAHVSDAFFGSYQPHGALLIVVDGSCGYIVYESGQANGGALRRGVLDEMQLAELNDDLLTQPWESLAGDRPPWGADGQVTTYRRGEHQATCLASCDDAVVELGQTTHDWALRLWASGTRMDGGLDVQVFVQSGEAPAGTRDHRRGRSLALPATGALQLPGDVLPALVLSQRRVLVTRPRGT